jgi:diacylglycerol kinase family enzyme
VGWLAYLPPAAMALFDRPFEARVVVDGREVRARSPLVLVANGRSVLHPTLRIASSISKSDGVFDVFIVTATGPVEKTRVLWRFMTRHLDLSPYVMRLRGHHVELATDPPLPVQFDGDVDGTTPVTLDIIPGALRVVTPNG